MSEEPMAPEDDSAVDAPPEGAGPWVVVVVALVAVLLVVGVVWMLSQRDQPDARPPRLAAGLPDSGLRAEVTEAAEQPDRDPFAAPPGAVPESPPEDAGPPEGVAEATDSVAPATVAEPAAAPEPDGPPPPPLDEPDLPRPDTKERGGGDGGGKDEPPPPPEPEPEPEPPPKPDRPSADELRALDPTGPPTWVEPGTLAGRGITLAAVVGGPRPTALFRVGQAFRRAREGEEIDGLRVERIHGSTVFLREGRARYRLSLVASTGGDRGAPPPPNGAPAGGGGVFDQFGSSSQSEEG